MKSLNVHDFSVERMSVLYLGMVFFDYSTSQMSIHTKRGAI